MRDQHPAFMFVNRHHAPVFTFMTYCSWIERSITGTLMKARFFFGYWNTCHPKFVPYEP
jgi:hypothetical protein